MPFHLTQGTFSFLPPLTDDEIRMQFRRVYDTIVEPATTAELTAAGFLVPARSTFQQSSDVDRPGVKIGISQGSTTQSELGRELKHASMVPVASLQQAITSTRRAIQASRHAITLGPASDRVDRSSGRVIARESRVD